MKIRGNTVGTPIKPKKVLVKCEDLTEEEKAQARANIGAASIDDIGSGILGYFIQVDHYDDGRYEIGSDFEWNTLVQFASRVDNLITCKMAPADGSDYFTMYTFQGLYAEDEYAVFVNVEGALVSTLMISSSGAVTVMPVTIGSGGSITVDSELSPTSTNPVQNKVITQLFTEAQLALEALTPDAALDENSTRPVQNKVICQQLAQAEATLGQIVGMIPTETAINALIDAKLGVIENGTY